MNLKSFLYIRYFRRKFRDLIMDKFFSIFTFPLGLVLCFAPALVLWLKAELKSPPSGKDKDE